MALVMPVSQHKTFFVFACGCSAPVRVEREGDAAAWLAGTLAAPWQVFRDTNCLVAGVLAPSESFLEPLGAGDQKASLASLSLSLHPFTHLEGSLAWRPCPLFGMSGK